MELFTRQAAVALFFGLFATSTQAKEFSYLETFDDDATFSAGGYYPTDGSATPQPFPFSATRERISDRATTPVRTCSARWHHRAWDATAGYTPAS